MYILIITIFNLILCIGGVYYFTLNKHSAEKGTCAKKRIAIFEPVAHPAIFEIEQGFVKEVQQKVLCECTIYNAQGNKTLLRSQAEEILHQNYDLIFTIGALCTQTIHELCSKKQNTTPVVFSSIDDPVTMGIAKSLKNSGNNFTGVIESSHYEKQIESLIELKPTTKQVLLVYDPTHGTGRLEKDKNYIQEFAEILDVVKKNNSNKIALIHAEDLYTNPETTMRGFCDTCGIPFSESNLQWEAFGEDFSGNEAWDEPKKKDLVQFWHHDAIRSTCFTKPTQYDVDENGPTFSEITNEEHRKLCMDAYKETLKHYDSILKFYESAKE